jgi:hypothetical protein
MTPEEFVQRPWAASSLHSAYTSSFLHMTPAPEYAFGEVVLASTYRAVGFCGGSVSEKKTPANGRAFQKCLDKGKRPRADAGGTGIDTEAWRRIIAGTLRSPKQESQSAKRFLQISPIVPDAALYSLSARLSSNSWNPGALVAKMIQMGTANEAKAKELWSRLFHALSVDENDDIWARFLQQEFLSWRHADHEACWREPCPLLQDEIVGQWRRAPVPTPAGRFAHDLEPILGLKLHLTRRQWISIVEALLRLGTASHVLWTCKVNLECFRYVRAVLSGKGVPPLEELEHTFGIADAFWRYGQLASGTITDHATEFVKARAGINLLLWHLNGHYESGFDECLANPRAVHGFLGWLDDRRGCIDTEKFYEQFQLVLEHDQRLVEGQKGIAANVKEFVRHVLGQRQTAEPGLDSYDQGYFLAKRGTYRSAPWSISLGPVSVLMIVHACTHNARGPRTVENLCKHLGQYGIEIKPQEVPGSRLGQTLRNLGLVLDSPDAEGGMVVVNPFEHVAGERA